MGMMDVSRRRRRMGSAVTPDYAAEVQTLLSGTAGYALNRMMHGWLLDGIDIGHVDLELADVFTMEPQFEEGCIYLLAERLSPDYAAPAQFSPSEFKKRLSAAFLIIPNSKFDRTLTRRRAWWAT